MRIYKITNLINFKVYIGQTKSSIASRTSSHIHEALKGKDRIPLLYRAIRKYGRHNFTIEEIVVCSNQEELDKEEIKYIKFYDSNNPLKGYNIGEGGKGNNGTKGKSYEELYGKEKAEKLKQLRSITMRNQVRSKEHCLNISKAKTGVKASEETKRKLSLLKRGSNNSFFGKKHTEETKKLIGSKSINRAWKRSATKNTVKSSKRKTNSK